jgi:hypothetical protein
MSRTPRPITLAQVAAPELLTALRTLLAATGPATIPLTSVKAVRQFGKLIAAQKAAEDAIAKAEGRHFAKLLKVTKAAEG